MSVPVYECPARPMRMVLHNRLDRITGAIRTLLGRVVLELFVNIGLAVLGAIYLFGKLYKIRRL